MELRLLMTFLVFAVILALPKTWAFYLKFSLQYLYSSLVLLLFLRFFKLEYFCVWLMNFNDFLSILCNALFFIVILLIN